MTFELEYLERDCEMTVLPQPKAPGMAVVPPCTQLQTLLIVVIENQVNNKLGNAASASLCVWQATRTTNIREQRIEHTLTSQQWVITSQLLGHRSLLTHRPRVHHFVLLLGALELQLKNVILDNAYTAASERAN
jgi:hypothetical protein